jgi:hypothetical protein
VAIFQILLLPSAQAAVTFVVTNVDDSGPGSLRQAITDANNNPGLDIITFNISGASRSIKPILTLPTITDPVVIDGTTQPGFAGTPVVELNGSAGAAGVGLSIAASGCTIRALVINKFSFSGILISNTSSGSHVEGCYIGTDSTGAVAMPNFGPGVSLQGSNNVIGGTSATMRNVISGNSGAGIQLELFCCTGTIPIAAGNLIQGNFIGVNAAGNAAVPNQREGILITTAGPDADVHGNTVGGTALGAGNVISGNRFDGIVLGSFQTTSNIVQGNFIGTDATGSFAIPNNGDGVSIDSSRNNIIGGSEPGARNVISGNGDNGSGTGRGNGLSVGNSAGASATGNIIRGNFVGIRAAGNAPLPNLLHGIAVVGSNNTIGGTNAGEGNVIAFSGNDGIVSAGPATGNSFRGNSIFSNGRNNHPSGVTIGIDLGNNGVTPNDVGDADAGTNGLQNFPAITSVTVGPTSVNLRGTIDSTANTNLNLDFYANSVCDATGFGEGARFIGSGSVTTNASGTGSFDLTFAASLTPNQVFSATATDPAGNTSEFSQCSPNSPAIGSVDFATSSVTVDESAGSTAFIVNRMGGTAGSLIVNYAVMGLTATAGSDFAPTQGTLTFADGETSKSFSVPILNDNIDEPFVETATVTLSTSGNLDTLGNQSTLTLNITDDDPTPSVSIGDVSAAEGNSGTTNFTFLVTLSNPNSRAVTISFKATDGTATGGGNDFVSPVTNSISIPIGQVNATITLSVVSDSVVEPDENFYVDLTTATNAIIVDGQGKATILNDDGSSTPLPIELVLEESALNNQAAALDLMLLLRDPFPMINDAYGLFHEPDRTTRVMVFVRNLELAAGEVPSSVIVKLIDSNGQSSEIAAADLRPLAGSDLAQLFFRLPDNLVPGICTIRVQAHSTVSNSGKLTIRN